MTMPTFGKISSVELREIWPKEAKDFSPWLAKNIGALGDALGIQLETAGEQVSVGSFAVDILAKDVSRGTNVVIETQLEPTNHDHLGKLITYAAGHDATAVVWIAKVIREEHRQALDWLNQHSASGIEFYGVVVEVIKIDNSNPAFSFKLVAFPNQWRKARIAQDESSVSERMAGYQKFFQDLIDQLRDKHRFTGARIARYQSWYPFASGISGITYTASFTAKNRFRVELYIDRGEAEINKRIFDRLTESKGDFERELGSPIEWERLDAKKASRIAIYRQGTIDDEAPTLDDIKEWATKWLLKFKKVFDGRLGTAVKVSSVSKPK